MKHLSNVNRMVTNMGDIEKELQDLRYLDWSRSRKSSGTAGSFLKSYDDTGKKKKYYKLSDYDPVKGIVGHECVNEIVVQRLLQLLKIDHLEYRLIHAVVRIDDRDCETYLCESEDYKTEGEGKIALEDYYLMEREIGESPYVFCARKGWEKYISDMLLVDYLILNRDRHGANIEVLRNEKKHSVRLAPLFDHGLSLLCRCRTIEEIKSFDVMEDKKVQAFVGSPSTFENISMLSKSYLKGLPNLRKKDLDVLFEGLDDVLRSEHIVKIREMIWRRWCSLGSI